MDNQLLAEAIALLKKDFAELGQVQLPNMKFVWDLIEGYEKLAVSIITHAEPVITVDTKGPATLAAKAQADKITSKKSELPY